MKKNLKMTELKGIYKLNKDIKNPIFNKDNTKFCKATFWEWEVQIPNTYGPMIDLYFKIREGKFKDKYLSLMSPNTLTYINSNDASDLYSAISALLRRNMKRGEIVNLESLCKKWCLVEIVGDEKDGFLQINHVMPL